MGFQRSRNGRSGRKAEYEGFSSLAGVRFGNHGNGPGKAKMGNRNGEKFLLFFVTAKQARSTEAKPRAGASAWEELS